MLDCSIAGIDRSAMPDHEELDSLPSINLETTHRAEVTTKLINIKHVGSCSINEMLPDLYVMK